MRRERLHIRVFTTPLAENNELYTINVVLFRIYFISVSSYDSAFSVQEHGESAPFVMLVRAYNRN